jgi:hypothetical protein
MEQTSYYGAPGREVGFAADSPVEGTGFEPPVPPITEAVSSSEREYRASRKRQARKLRQNWRDRGFESRFLQRGVWRELDPVDQGAELQLAGHRMMSEEADRRAVIGGLRFARRMFARSR